MTPPRETTNFVGLSREDCTYLLTLIEEMDSATPFTERQRGYTVPKIRKIQQDPHSGRLAFQDVEYLLDLIEDDDLPELEQQREMTRSTLEEIRSLQVARFSEAQSVEQQREARRAKRNAPKALAEHFAQGKL